MVDQKVSSRAGSWAVRTADQLVGLSAVLSAALLVGSKADPKDAYWVDQ